MRIAIIGGGISGLYTAWKLLESNKSLEVHVFEASNRLGGRIYTIHKGHTIYEAGAGRFNKSHKRLFRLLRELGLNDKVQPISGPNNKRTFVKNGIVVRKDIVQALLFNNIVETHEHERAHQKAYLQSITMKQYMEELIGKQKTQDVIDAFGYNSEFEVQNAYTSLKVFKSDFNDHMAYYYLQGGMSQIVSRLHERLLSLGCHFHFKSTVKGYCPESGTLSWFQNTMQVNKVIFAVTKDALAKLIKANHSLDGLVSYIDNVVSTPLCRIFAKFPVESTTGTVWFDGLTRITTNNKLRYIIPYNVAQGIIQITYTDNDNARYWGAMNRASVADVIMKELSLMFPERGPIPHPTWVNVYYWKEGAHYWKPGPALRACEPQNVHVVGEMTSRFHTAWIEGALESAEKLLARVKI